VIQSTLVQSTSDAGGRGIRRWTLMAMLVPVALGADALARRGGPTGMRESLYSMLGASVLAALATVLVAKLVLVHFKGYQRIAG
jgi:hypothetical protein